MRHVILSLLFTVPGLLALQPKPALDCNHQGDHHRAGHFCEIREQSMAAGGMLNVDASQNGGISVKGWDRTDVLVRAQVQAQAETDDEARELARQVTVQAGGTQVRAVGPTTTGRDRGWSVSYEVFVPVRSSVNLQTVNGGVSLSDVNGNLEFRTTNGGLSLHRVAGYVHGQTTNGGVSIELAGDHWDGQGLDVRTVNGGLKLKVPQGYSAQFDASTQNGGVKSEVAELQPADRRTNHLGGALGRGGAMVKVATVNGGVTISR